MSLINDLLCDLQERRSEAAVADRLADLAPVVQSRIPRIRKRWVLAPVGALLIAGSAWAVWRVGGPTTMANAQAKLAPLAVADAPSDVASDAAADRDAVTASELTRVATDALRNTLKLDRNTPDVRRLYRPMVVTQKPAPRVVKKTARVSEDIDAGHDARGVSPRLALRETPAVTAAAPGDDDAQHSRLPPPTRTVAADPRRDALAALAEGRVADAEAGFRRLIQRDRSATQAWLYLGRALEQQRRGSDAERVYAEALTVVADPAPVARALARRMVERGATLAALQLLEAHRSHAPLNPDHDAFVAALQQRLGRHEIAAESYRNILAVRPQTAAWWVGLAISEEALGNGTEALNAYRHARNVGNLDARLADYTDKRIAAMKGAEQS